MSESEGQISKLVQKSKDSPFVPIGNTQQKKSIKICVMKIICTENASLHEVSSKLRGCCSCLVTFKQ